MTQSPSPQDPPTILLVDDDADARLMFATYLSGHHCVIYDAADGRAAIDRAIELRPDVIVLDLAMPRVDGWTALIQLRSSSWTADIPVLVVSALCDARDEALRLGADAWLTKPCAPATLWSRIKGLLRATPQTRARLHR